MLLGCIVCPALSSQNLGNPLGASDAANGASFVPPVAHKARILVRRFDVAWCGRSAALGVSARRQSWWSRAVNETRVGSEWGSGPQALPHPARRYCMRKLAQSVYCVGRILTSTYWPRCIDGGFEAKTLHGGGVDKMQGRPGTHDPIFMGQK